MLQLMTIGILLYLLSACNKSEKTTDIATSNTQIIMQTDTIHTTDTLYIDCNYTFDQAIAGTNAPEEIISQLELITVHYYSTDEKIHQGQILANKKIIPDLKELFRFILKTKFPVTHAIPIVRFNWDDTSSMLANNTYSFCYRNISYSKHAQGMAIDINPFFNPQRFKNGQKRKSQPEGAVYNPDIPGTFYPEHPVVVEFEKRGYKWGHYFSTNYDDHHFEKILPKP